MTASRQRAARREHVELRGMGRVARPSQEPGADQGLERLLDLREIIPDVLGQALAEEEGPRMPVEEQQQVEIARMPQAPNAIEKIPDARGRHALGRQKKVPE